MKNIFATMLITLSIIIGFASFTSLLIVNRIHSIHAVTGEIINTLGNGEYFLITVMSLLLIAVMSVVIKERHFA